MPPKNKSAAILLSQTRCTRFLVTLEGVFDWTSGGVELIRQSNMGAEIFLYSAWDAYCERLPLLKERGRIDPVTKADPMHLGRSLWHLASVVDSNATDEERMVGNGYFRCGDDLLSAMGLSWSNTVAPMLDEREFLPVSRAAELLELIENHPLTDERPVSGLTTKANALHRQRELLMTLLRRSIELREPLEVIVFEGGPPNA